MPKESNLFEYCKNIGDFSSFMLRTHLVEIGEMDGVNDEEKLKSIDFKTFEKLWREKIGPKFYYDSIVSIERQIEILKCLGMAFPFYVKRKKAIIEEKANSTIDFTKPAWFSINTADTEKGNRLQIGFTNYGCDYWRNGAHHVGCYNCGFFLGVNASEKNKADNLNKNILKQFEYVLENVSGEKRVFDAIDFVGDGSFLNENEIPFESQQELFRRIARMPNIKRILVESRPVYIEGKNIRTLLDILREDQKLEIGIGLETVDRFVAVFCINKGFLLKMDNSLKQALAQKDIYDVIDIVKSFNESKNKNRLSLQIYALVKPALLTEIECLYDAVNTGRYLNKLSHQTGVNLQVKYEPTVIPKGTLLEVLNDIYINKKGEVINPMADPETIIDFFNEEEQKKNDWRPLHAPPSYWTIVELISQLAIDNSHKIIRIGGREDMHVSKSIPAVYDSKFGSLGMLSKIDFRLYYAVQKFNTHKNITRLLEDIKTCLNTESFKKWKEEEINLLSPQIVKDAEDLIADIKPDRVEEEFLNGLEEVIENFEYSESSQSFIKVLSAEFNVIEDAKQKILDYILEKIHQKFEFIQREHVELISIEYIKNEHKNIKKPELFRLEISIFNPVTKKIYDIWTFIPRQAISHEASHREKRTEIERKFIVEYIPGDIVLPAPTQITQGYISITKSNEVRVRRKVKAGVSKYVLTWKSKGDKTREEIEVDIDEKAFKNLILATEGKLIEKERFEIPFCFIDNNKSISFDIHEYPGNKTFKIELDIFKGHLFGLLVAEIEFDSEKESGFLTTKNIPGWFGKEVTYDKRFKNQNLSRDKFDAIIIQTSKKYESDCICFSENSDFIDSAKHIIEKKEMNFRVFDKKVETLGEINADVVEMFRGCKLALFDTISLDINQLTKFAVRETATPRTILIDGNNHGDLSSEIDAALNLSRNETVISTFEEISLSKIIETQLIIDNEILSMYEKKSNEIWVITSTMEFDVGDLQEAVDMNLAQGKDYVYYVPNKKSNAYYNEIFKRNFNQFKINFNEYLGAGQITIKSFPEKFEYYFKEMIIYDALSDTPFGFTYIVNNRSEDFELIKINKKILKKIIHLLAENCA